VRAVLRRFPPSCVVRVRTDRFHPDVRALFDAYEGFAVLRSVFEGGQLGLGFPDSTEVRFQVDERDVEGAVAFFNGMTREWVAAVLER
jgi:hypothetical protein